LKPAFGSYGVEGYVVPVGIGEMYGVVPVGVGELYGCVAPVGVGEMNGCVAPIAAGVKNVCLKGGPMVEGFTPLVPA